jgi:hypothetical protein
MLQPPILPIVGRNKHRRRNTMSLNEYLEKRHKLMDIVEPLVDEAYPHEKCASKDAADARHELKDKLYKCVKEAYEFGKSAKGAA